MLKNISELRKYDKLNYGNKAAVLGQLSGKFKLPEGIALPVNFFDEYITYNHYPFICGEYLQKNREIQAFIRQSEFAQSQKNMIKDELRRFQKIIVRSSAICEDTDKFNMAGMFVSSDVLNKTDGIFFAVKECYCSLFSDRVLEYFDDRNLDFSLLKMGLIIQEYIEGMYSGVIFTADTKDHNPNIIYINYVEGKCSNFADRSARSYYIMIDKETKNVVGGNYNENDNVQLSDELIASLTDTALEIEKELGFYSDIEWTYDGKNIYVLQARPITTIKDQRAVFEVDNSEKDNEWFLIEPEPVRPLFESYFRIFFDASGEGLIRTGYRGKYMVMKSINGYIYLSERKMENVEELRQKAIEQLKDITDKGLSIFDDYCLPRFLPIKNSMDKYINSEKNSDTDIADLLNLSIEYAKTALIVHWESVLGETYIDDFRKYLEKIYGKIGVEELYNLIYMKTLKTMEREFLLEIADFFQNNSYMIEILNSSAYPLIVYERLKLAKDWDSLNTLIKNYLNVFGMGYAAKYKYNLPAYPLREKPQYIIEQVKKIISQNKTEYLASILNLQEKKANIKEHILQTITEEYRGEFEQKLFVAEKTFASIDNHHYYCEDIQWGYVKTALTFASERLIENGLIKSHDDIYYIDFDEICGLLKKDIFNNDIDERKNKYNKNRGILAPNKIISESYQKAKKEENIKPDSSDTNSDKIKILHGVSSLNRIVEGTILIGQGAPGDIPDDCILVVRDGHAGDLFPLIDKIKGLIVAGGSPFDHMGIITREMNIPALYYVKDAVSILKTGDKVVLNGEKSIIEII